MATFEVALTLEKRLVNVIIESDSEVYVYGEAVEVTSLEQMATTSGNITSTLTTLQKRAVADLMNAAKAWVDAQEFTVVSPP
jgi:hypothetical protein